MSRKGIPKPPDPNSDHWYFDRPPSPQGTVIPITEGILWEDAIKLLALKCGRSFNTVKKSVDKHDNPDGTIDLCAYGYLIRYRPPHRRVQVLQMHARRAGWKTEIVSSTILRCHRNLDEKYLDIHFDADSKFLEARIFPGNTILSMRTQALHFLKGKGSAGQ